MRQLLTDLGLIGRARPTHRTGGLPSPNRTRGHPVPRGGLLTPQDGGLPDRSTSRRAGCSVSNRPCMPSWFFYGILIVVGVGLGLVISTLIPKPTAE